MVGVPSWWVREDAVVYHMSKQTRQVVQGTETKHQHQRAREEMSAPSLYSPACCTLLYCCYFMYEYLGIKRKNELVGLERDYGFSHSVTSCLGWESMYEYGC